jgi:hypothetical protein
MKTKQLIELLAQFDPETTVIVTYPAPVAFAGRVDTEFIHVEELARYDGIHPLISANGAHLLED